MYIRAYTYNIPTVSTCIVLAVVLSVTAAVLLITAATYIYRSVSTYNNPPTSSSSSSPPPLPPGGIVLNHSTDYVFTPMAAESAHTSTTGGWDVGGREEVLVPSPKPERSFNATLIIHCNPHPSALSHKVAQTSQAGRVKMDRDKWCDNGGSARSSEKSTPGRQRHTSKQHSCTYTHPSGGQGPQVAASTANTPR